MAAQFLILSHITFNYIRQFKGLLYPASKHFSDVELNGDFPKFWFYSDCKREVQKGMEAPTGATKGEISCGEEVLDG